MESLWYDAKHAVRSLLRAPLFLGAAVLTIALGIGANTAIFSVVDAVLLRPLRYAEPERLVMLWEQNDSRKRDRNVVSPANFLDWKREASAFSDMVAFTDWHLSLTGEGEPEELTVEYATGNVFAVLGATPVMGRGFTATESAPNGPEVAVLSTELWRRRFGGDPRIIGRVISLGGRPHEVVGVMPEGFSLPGSRAALWIPLPLNPATNYREKAGRYLQAIGRLRTGVSLEQAQSQLSSIAKRLEGEHPTFNANWGVNAVPLKEQVVGGTQTALLVLAGVVAFVLLVACANVANLQLVRSASRAREIAVRSALGAGRARVARQLLAESLVIALLGAVLGLLMAWWGTTALGAVAMNFLPRATEISVDGRVVTFTVALALLTAVVFGALPALRGSGSDLQSALREGGRGSSAARSGRSLLVSIQVALSLVLLVGAGLMVRSFVRLSTTDPGFLPEGVLTFRLDLPRTTYANDTQRVALFDDALGRLRATPGVRSASAITWLPFGGLGSATSYFVEGRPVPPPGEQLSADVRGVDYDYFRTMRIPVRRGETFTARDRAGTRRVAVINETLARTVFAGTDPIGQRILMPWDDTLRGEVIGVVADAQYQGLDSLPRPMVYWAMPQFPSSFMAFAVRADGDPMRVAGAVGSAIHAIDANLPLADLKTMEALLGDSVARHRFTVFALGIFAAVALALAMIGLYGALAYSVAQRTREIGVRIALGAKRETIVGMIVREGLTVVAAGAVAGGAAALLLTRVLRSLLFEVSPTDPLTFVGVVAVLGAISVLASFVPARQATRVDPVDALRND